MLIRANFSNRNCYQGGTIMKKDRCQRCGEIKESNWFDQSQPYWRFLCRRCEESPTGAMPIKQTKEKHWKDD